jgi:hypothetical protein
MIEFYNEARIEVGGEITVGKVVGCDISIRREMYGYELSFEFHVLPTAHSRQNPRGITEFKVEAYFKENHQPLRMGRLYPQLYDPPETLGKNDKLKITRCLFLRPDELITLIDKTHHANPDFEFNFAVGLEGRNYNDICTGRMTIPQTVWLKIIEQARVARFELIAIRSPVSDSHLHQPFSEALDKIREAERYYLRGDWNAVGASCRAALRTILSSVPSGTPPIDQLLAPVTGDPRRKAFAQAVTKCLLDVLNAATHLEGTPRTGTPPTDLRAEDALLCLHWYSSVIGYLASFANAATTT